MIGHQRTYRHLLISVDELWLKGKNRPDYFAALKSHLSLKIKSFHQGHFKIENRFQRLAVVFDDAFDEALLEILGKIPGIFSLTPCRRIEQELGAFGLAGYAKKLAEVVLEDFLRSRPNSFKVICKRSDKRFPYKSLEVAREVGGCLLALAEKANLPLRVDVVNPDVFVDVRPFLSETYLSVKSVQGVGGLPVGSSGHFMTLLSGGFDSPVASYMMSKRGCKQTFVFFHAYPFVGEEVMDKILPLFGLLGQYQKETRLYQVPFGDLQHLISKCCRKAYRTLLFRRSMIEAANLLADRMGGQALITGDSLSQVSSQTLENIAHLDRVCRRPIFRPLTGFNKREIIESAKKIGTYDISVLPQDDACSLLSPKHPILAPKGSYWQDFCEKHTFREEIVESLDQAQIYEISSGGEVEKTV